MPVTVDTTGGKWTAIHTSTAGANLLKVAIENPNTYKGWSATYQWMTVSAPDPANNATWRELFNVNTSVAGGYFPFPCLRSTAGALATNFTTQGTRPISQSVANDIWTVVLDDSRATWFGHPPWRTWTIRFYFDHELPGVLCYDLKVTNEAYTSDNPLPLTWSNIVYVDYLTKSMPTGMSWRRTTNAGQTLTGQGVSDGASGTFTTTGATTGVLHKSTHPQYPWMFEGVAGLDIHGFATSAWTNARNTNVSVIQQRNLRQTLAPGESAQFPKMLFGFGVTEDKAGEGFTAYLERDGLIKRSTCIPKSWERPIYNHWPRRGATYTLAQIAADVQEYIDAGIPIGAVAFDDGWYVKAGDFDLDPTFTGTGTEAEKRARVRAQVDAWHAMGLAVELWHVIGADPTSKIVAAHPAATNWLSIGGTAVQTDFTGGLFYQWFDPFTVNTAWPAYLANMKSFIADCGFDRMKSDFQGSVDAGSTFSGIYTPVDKELRQIQKKWIDDVVSTCKSVNPDFWLNDVKESLFTDQAAIRLGDWYTKTQALTKWATRGDCDIPTVKHVLRYLQALGQRGKYKYIIDNATGGGTQGNKSITGDTVNGKRGDINHHASWTQVDLDEGVEITLCFPNGVLSAGGKEYIKRMMNGAGLR